MHWKAIFKVLGLLFVVLSFFLLPCALTGFLFQDGSTKGLLLAFFVVFLSGSILFGLFRKESLSLGHRDAFVLVSLSWASAGLLGSLPYIFTGVLPSLTNAVFESVSGFTTTGATVLTGLEGLPKGIHLWRSLTQWLGGMGIIVLSVAILPFLGVGGMEIFRAEVPSPVVEKIRPRLQDTAKALWGVYVLLSAMECVGLILCGVAAFDAVCHTFTTMPTGGFSTMDISVKGLNNPFAEWIIIVFMFMAGMNFTIHYELLKGRFGQLKRNTEFLWYGGIILGFSILALVSIRDIYPDLQEGVRAVLFQGVSIITTTGYITEDYDKWPDVVRFSIYVLMFVGAMAGSTGGAIKVMRIVLLLKHAYHELVRLIHPHMISATKMGNRVVSGEVIRSSLAFFILYIATFIIGTMMLTALGMDLGSAAGAVASSLGNVGPAFGSVGPTFTYSEVPLLGKWILCLLMILGRLELMTLLVLGTPSLWKR